MKDIFEYLDYREFLRDFYEEKKSRNYFYSYRYMAQKVGIDHSLLVKVFLGKRHISSAMIPRFVQLCGLSGKKEGFFEALVNFGKAKNDNQSKIFLERMMSLKSVSSKKIEAGQYEYFQKWYYSAIRSLLDTCSFGDDYKAIGDKLNPSIQPREVKRAIALLRDLGFIRKDKQGIWRVTETHLSIGEQWRSHAVKAYQKTTIELSAGSLDRDPPASRDISSLTLSVDKECFDDVREMVRQLRETVKKRVDDMGPNPRDRVYQLNMQLIPLTKPVSNKKNGAQNE
jgi:uncharacterized protein (TIGR02147 family)